eukprot:TRINITY_DN9400_c0_g1_i1.p1 TRINITY_DN9400_c0_g1~~TRINITY_DN9400_c0_g1_i1.p1  ORF type:complete len:290 (-),score=64.47 TRINITY_DN9400_c0_g1_i1:163-969(-)
MESVEWIVQIDELKEQKIELEKILKNNSLIYVWQLMELDLQDLKSIFNLGQSTMIWKKMKEEKEKKISSTKKNIVCYLKENQSIIDLGTEVIDNDVPLSKKWRIEDIPGLISKEYKEEDLKKISRISFQSCQFNTKKSLEIIYQIIMKILPSCKYVDLSLNRYQFGEWGTLKNILHNLIKSKRDLKFIICYTALGSIDSIEYLKMLRYDEIDHLIWIPEKWLEKGNWLKCLGLEVANLEEKKEDPTYQIAIKIKDVHKEYYKHNPEFD